MKSKRIFTLLVIAAFIGTKLREGIPQNQKQNECAEVMQARHAARFFILEQIERTGRRKALYDSFKSVDGDICAGNDLDVSFQSYIACAL